MKTLATLQHTFQDCVLKPGKPDSIAWISASGRADPEIQLSIYTHAYAARLKEVLANDYPAVLMAIGDDRFNQLAVDYIQAHPSQYFSLRDFGRHFPEFVSSLIQQDEAQGSHREEMPWIYEMTMFEWTLGQAFDAADDGLFSEQDMANIPPEDWPELTFTLHPSVHRLDFEWNIPEMWTALTNNNPTQINARRESASPWLIWRDKLVTRFRSLQSDEQLALDTLSEGSNFNNVCDAIATLMHEDEVPLRAAGLLKGWLAQGLISDIHQVP